MPEQNTTICFDFGNTRFKYAVFRDRNLKDVFVLEDIEPATIQQVLEEYQPQKTILSSVVNHPAEVEKLLDANSGFHYLSHSSKLPFSIPIGKKETIGADRLALMAAAVHQFPHAHTLVIALGSCITFNFIDKFGTFLGGAISPGMNMRFNAMHHYTAKLPLVSPHPIFPLTGYDTRTNLLSGVIHGIRGEINYQLDSYADKYRNFNAVLTGGDIRFFAPHLKKKIFADPYFIYKGLYAISELNS